MRQFLSIIALLSALWVSAQQITVSDEIALRSDIGYEIIGKLGGHVLLFRNQSTAFEVEAYNRNMQLSWTKELVLDRRAPRLVGITADADDFSLVYLFRQSNETILKVHKYDPAANLIDSITIKNLGYLFYSPRFEIVFSEDRTKALAYYIDQQNIFRFYSFDLAQMALLWEKSVVIDDAYAPSDFLRVLVDNSGRMYYLRDRNNYRAKNGTHYYEFVSYDGAGEVVLYRINMGPQHTFDVTFAIDNLNQRLIAAGFYGARDNLQADGYFYLSVPPLAPTDHLQAFIPFQEEFLTALLGREYKPQRGLLDVDVMDMVLRRDGGVLLVAERNHQLERRGPTTRFANDAPFRLLIDYYYDEILAASINPDGALHWQAILHKKQFSQDDDGVYSSFFLMKTAGQLRFLFNDEIRYENTVSEYTLNGLGDRDRHSLFSTEKLDLRLRFRAAAQVSANEVIIPSEKRSRLRLIQLSY